MLVTSSNIARQQKRKTKQVQSRSPTMQRTIESNTPNSWPVTVRYVQPSVQFVAARSTERLSYNYDDDKPVFRPNKCDNLPSYNVILSMLLLLLLTDGDCSTSPAITASWYGRYSDREGSQRVLMVGHEAAEEDNNDLHWCCTTMIRYKQTDED